MSTTEEIQQKLRDVLPKLKSNFGVATLSYFGSLSKGTFGPQSDVDLLVSFSKPIGWGFFDLKFFLEDLLSRKVDLVTQGSIRKEFEKEIENTKVDL